MANSYTETTSLTCPHCGESFAAEIWLIIDAAERPELVEKIKQGNSPRDNLPGLQPIPASRRYAMDEITFRYAPSAHALRTAQAGHWKASCF